MGQTYVKRKRIAAREDYWKNFHEGKKKFCFEGRKKKYHKTAARPSREKVSRDRQNLSVQ